MKRLIALLVLVAAIVTTTIGCGSDTSGTTVKKTSSPTGSTSGSTEKKPSP